MGSENRSIQAGYQSVRGYEGTSEGQSPLRQVAPLIKSIVLGGGDGLLLSVSVLSAAAGGGLSWQYSLIMGFAVVFAGSVAYGLGEFISFKNHREYARSAKRVKMWELRNNMDAVVQQMVKRFVARGLNVTDAEGIVLKMATCENFFVGLMISDELGISIEDDDASLITDGLVNVFSFALIGCLPLVNFAVLAAIISNKADPTSVFPVSLVCCCTLAFMFGALKSQFVASSSYVNLGLEAVIILCLCSGLAFSCAKLVSNHIN